MHINSYKKKYVFLLSMQLLTCRFLQAAGPVPSAVNFTGTLAGDVTGTQKATVVAKVDGVTAAHVASGANLANAATNLSVANTLIKRDASKNFSAGTITAALTGNATTATTATNFSGSLAGDVTGSQSKTAVAKVGGVTAANIAAGVTLANAATSTNIINTIVKRDGSGTIIATLNGNASTATSATTATTATNFSGSLVGDVTGHQGATVVGHVGGATAASIATGAIVANAATDANTAGTIVMRDISGNFAAGTITLDQLNPTDPMTTNKITINGDLGVTVGNVLFVDNIFGVTGGPVSTISVFDIVLYGNTLAPSDQRLKTDITDLDNEHCLALVNQIVPREFDYIPGVQKAVSDDGKRHVGFIAQELAKVDPRFVSIPTGTQRLGDLTIEELAFVKQELFVPVLVGALKAEDKKLLAEIAETQKLQARVQALEEFIASMKHV